MRYTEEINDIFSLKRTENMAYVQCISADFAMGAGIAVSFNKYFNTKQTLMNRYPGAWTDEWDNIPPSKRGMCIYAEPVFNLVTKQTYWQKPSLQTLQNALFSLKEQVMERGITVLACPQFGSGLDKLSWDSVRKLMIDTFKDTNVDIVVCGMTRTKDFPYQAIETSTQLEPDYMEME